MTNNEIKIPEKHYVTFQKRDGDDLPLAFITPYGEDAAATKRMSTADSWASGDIKARTIDNDLMAGFRICHSVRRFRTQNVLWRVADPRGFELEISSDNLADLLATVTVEKGEILSRCVWARQRNRDVLLPEESEEYQTAIANTQRNNKTVNFKDVKPGNTIIFKNGETGKYLGSFYALHFTRLDKQEDNSENLFLSPKKRHYFYVKKLLNSWHNGASIKSISNPKVSELVDDSTMSTEEAELFINTKFQNCEVQVVDARNDSEYRFVGVTSDKINLDNTEINLEKIVDFETFYKEYKNNLDERDIYIPSRMFVVKCNDGWYYKRHTTINDLSSYQFNRDALLKDKKLTTILTYEHQSRNSGQYFTPYPREIKYSASYTDDWYMPQLTFENPKTKNKFKLYLP